MELVIDRLVMHETPQSSTWLFCTVKPALVISSEMSRNVTEP